MPGAGKSNLNRPKGIVDTRLKQVGSTPPTMLPNAPSIYVAWYRENRITSDRASKLQLLICHRTMEPVWREIAACNPDDRFYEDLWDRLGWVELEWRLASYPRSRKRDVCKQIVEALSLCCDRMGPYGPFDVSLDQFLSKEQRAALGVLDAPSPEVHGRDVMVCGTRLPTTLNVLEFLLRRANELAEGALTEPRIIERRTRNWRERYFVRTLRDFLRKRLRKPFLGTTARISRLMMENDDIDVVFVRNALR